MYDWRPSWNLAGPAVEQLKEGGREGEDEAV